MKNVILIFALLSPFLVVRGQEISILAADLRAPVGLDRSADGTLWVAESGTGNNDGAVTVIWPDGSQERVIDNIYSVFDTLTQETVGPLRVQVLNDTYIAVYTPISDASPSPTISIFLRSDFSPGGDVKSLDDAVSVIRVGEFVYGRGGFNDSNPYTLVHDGCDMYIVDAAANAVIHRDGLTGTMNVFAEFAPLANPLPFGPPFVDAVPTRILQDPEGGFFVSQLTGFPFVDGLANIYHVSEEGNVTVAYDQMTLVTDMALSPDGDGLYALQFARFNPDSIPPFYFNSAQVIHLHANQTRDTIAAGFGPSPGLAVDADGNCYVTHLFFGLVMKIDHGSTGIADSGDPDHAGLLVYPNPSHGTLHVQFDSSPGTDAEVRVYNLSGQIVWHEVAVSQGEGGNLLEINTHEWATGVEQPYLITVTSGDRVMRKVVVIK